jgi:AcrR family transcriptional regulator
MRARADSAAATADRVVAATIRLFPTMPWDDLTLGAIAEAAGVTVQTVIRRFGSKDGVYRAAVERVTASVTEQRAQAPVGDVAAAVANLVDHYETTGDIAMHLLRQELGVPVIAETTTFGRRLHADWVERVFAPWLDAARGAARKRLCAQLVAVCDVYTWHLLRRQGDLSRAATEASIRQLVEGVLP